MLSADGSTVIGCNETYSGGIVIPEGVISLGYRAFMNNINLKSISLPSSLEIIKSESFRGCLELSYIKIGINVREIRNEVFAETNVYVDVEDGNPSFTSINGSLFNKQKSLLIHYFCSNPVCGSDLPNTLKSIGSFAFSGIRLLRVVKLPDQIEYIGRKAFYDCTNLEEIHFPKNLENISDIRIEGWEDTFTVEPSCVFENCISLKRVILNNNLKEISNKTFLNCCSLKEITFPKSVSIIANGSFEGCVGLTNITIESEKVTIGTCAFNGCSNVKKVLLPIFHRNMLFTCFQPFKDLEIVCVNGGERNKTPIDTEKIWYSKSIDFRFFSMYYHNLGMNITRVQGNASKLYSYREPQKKTGFELEKLYNKEQDVSILLKENWLRATGIGLVLGWNDFRAIDVSDYSDFATFVDVPKLINTDIEYCLKTMGLPFDYQWVIKYGSYGNDIGFCIIIKVEDFGEIDKGEIEYEFTDWRQGLRSSFKCERISFRYKGNVMLPPSIFPTGNEYLHFHNLPSLDTANDEYTFLRNQMPASIPCYVKLSSINNLCEDFCGNNVYMSYSWNDRDIELVEIKKQSWLPEDDNKRVKVLDYMEDSIEWLEACDSPQSYNSLAIRYVFGNSVQSNPCKAYELFLKSNTVQSYFNLASLISIGYFKGTIQDVNGYLERIDIEKLAWRTNYPEGVDEMLSQIRNKAMQYLYKKDGDTYLFFDTETTGIPADYQAPSMNTDNWPRLVQIAWVLTDEKDNMINTANLMVRPDGFTIPTDAAKVHGITTEVAMNEGIPLSEAIHQFIDDLNTATYIVGHNIDFDKKIVGAEMIRLGMKDIMDSKKSYCTMQSSINFCKIPGKYGYKYPKLQELYKKLFGTEFDNAHDAMSDIEATAKCFWELRKRKLI
jgi:DNA polymerase III epsilon subunit-like protein